MKINKIQTNCQTSFGIKISSDFIKAADELYCGKRNKDQLSFNKIYRKAKYMEEHYGFDDYIIILKDEYEKNKPMKALYAIKDDGSENILLTMKDSLSKLFEKFSHINEYELSVKIGKTTK